MRCLLIIFAFFLCCPFINFKKPFLLRNIFIFYLYAIYNIAPYVFGDADERYYVWLVEFFVLIMVFVLGYIRGQRSRRFRISAVRPISQSGVSFNKKDKFLISGMIVLLMVHLFVIVKTIKSFGLSGFYSGAQSASLIADYGKLNVSGAVNQVITFGLGVVTLAVLAVLLERMIVRRFISGKLLFRYECLRRRLILILAMIWLLLFPLIQFSRSGFVFGSMVMLAIWYWSRKHFPLMRFVVLIICAISVFIFIGQSRGERLGQRVSSSKLFISELSPWVAYRDIRDNMDRLNYQYGRTLVTPLFLRLVPRGMWPEKPQNSGGYSNYILYPGAAQTGFMIAPTYLGALYLNFGFIGVIFGTILLGYFSGWVDGIVLYQHWEKIGLFFIVFSSYICILRNDPAITIFDLMAVIIFYLLISKWASTYKRRCA
ncbi:MAG: O-antigen ligase [Candidatus Omnitrophica bacterium]|nr:O-antigen ligase [Candidatus Omnitrophota bacterium]